MSENKKYNVLLDLDNTIIYGYPTEDYNFEKNKDKASKFKFEVMENLYIIFERPYLQKFLTFLFKNFNVSVWTAASKDYALFIIDKIIIAGKKNRKLDYIFFSYHCSVSKKLKKNIKDLRILWENYNISGYNENNTFIIDDYIEEVYNPQKNNCIIAKPPFEFDDDESFNDVFLKNLISELKKLLKNNDLKTVINNINNKSVIKNDNKSP